MKKEPEAIALQKSLKALLRVFFCVLRVHRPIDIGAVDTQGASDFLNVCGTHVFADIVSCADGSTERPIATVFRSRQE